jgi:hypothetical protein
MRKTHAVVKSTKKYYNVKGLGASILLYFAESSAKSNLLRDLRNSSPIMTKLWAFRYNATLNAKKT